MARPLRIEFPGALYHVTSRGNARAPIFLGDADRTSFLETLGEVVERHGWLCYAYCLMPNHYHLLLETPAANLSQGMRQLNGLYTQRFNRRHDGVGHVFQGRFKGILVERETHFCGLARYIVLNPVRAGILADAEQYRWSSLRAALGFDPAPSWLRLDAVPAAFGSRNRYREFIRDAGRTAPASPWGELRGSILGSPAFVNDLRPRLETTAAHREFPRRERLAHRPSLAELFPRDVVGDRPRRNARIREASRVRGYLLSEIGRHLGLHYATVSRIAASRPGEPPAAASTRASEVTAGKTRLGRAGSTRECVNTRPDPAASA
jgi:REP element-mobilizing transposase RayT